MERPDPASVLVTGGAGLLGAALLRTAPSGLTVHATFHRRPIPGPRAHRVELADSEEAEALLGRVRPGIVVHTAYAKEEGEANILRATGNVARAARRFGAALVHVSTDLVFDGTLAPYGEDDPPAPVNEYGTLKADAESAVCDAVPEAAIVRPSLIVAVSPPDPASAWVADAIRTGEAVHLFADELRCPIGAEDLARCIWEIACLPSAEHRGVWHVAGPEVLSRYALGLLIAHRHGLDPGSIVAVSASASPVPRPRDLRLVSSRRLAHRPAPVSVLFGLTPDG